MSSESNLRDDGPKLVGAAPVLTGMRNPRGVPQLAFIDDIAGFLETHKITVEDTIQALSTMHSKYRFMETQTNENKARIKLKIPDISASLEAVEMLIKKQEAGEDFTTFFGLADQVYAKASVRPQNRVGLWLGAGIMLEYDYEEARTLLRDNLAAAETKLAHFIEDLAFLRDQVITTEVNMARVFNHDVKVRRATGKAGPGASGGAGAPALIEAR